MTNPLSSILRLLFTNTAPYRRWRHRRLFPRLAVDDTANLQISGPFNYGAGAQIGPHSNIVVFTGGALEIGAEVFIGRGVELGTDTRMRIGDQTSIQDGSVILGTVDIGRYCTIAYRLYASSGRHHFDLKPAWLIKDQDAFAQNSSELAALGNRPVVIEDDCWIGANVVVMQGVTIGKGSVIGANSVVTENIPPYSVAMGAPARVSRQRLAFAPPPRIDAANPLHLPYFYAGFQVRQNDLEKAARAGGMIAGESFIIAMAAPGAKKVVLSVRALIDKSVRLRFGDQITAVGSEPAEVVFSLPADAGDKLQFAVESHVNGAEILALAGARLEN